MSKSTNSLSKILFSVTVASAMVIVTGESEPAGANNQPTDSSFPISLDFENPNDMPPRTVGGGVRGNIQFAAPGDEAPVNTVGGGVRGNIQFAAPGDEAPVNTAGGGVRGNIQFATPGEAAPSRVVGGGVRGDVDFTAPGESAPVNTSGGGVRGDVDFTAPGESAPVNTSGGGVRGDVNFEAPGSNDAPNQTSSGGVRGEALAKMVPLMPTTNYGRTISARPTFLVYVPPTASKEVFFSLQDANRNHHYQTKFPISGEGGIVALTLPDDAPELEMGKEYVWYLAPIAPDGILRPDNYGVNGWVKRVPSPIASDRLSSLSPINLATLYAKEGIWYDTLQVLSAAKLAQPDDATLASEWNDLLEQVELEAIANQPISEPL